MQKFRRNILPSSSGLKPQKLQASSFVESGHHNIFW
jgi:hypothetical protein